MGYDVSFHPISPEEMQEWYFTPLSWVQQGQEEKVLAIAAQNGIEDFYAEKMCIRDRQWNDEDEYTRCIQALNAIPEDWRNYRIAYAMARALENYAIIGDHDEGTLKSKGDKALLRAIEVLESVREEGQDKAEWNMRMAYGYQYLYGQEDVYKRQVIISV